MQKEPFRTPTGQTGRDAYVFEATAIANSYRELNERMQSLVRTVREESPQMFRNESDFFWAEAKDASHFSAYLRLNEEGYMRWLRGER